MADIYRSPTRVEVLKRRYDQIDYAPNLITSVFPKFPPFIQREEFTNRVEPRKWAQDHLWSGTTTRGIPLAPALTDLPRAPLITPILRTARLQPDLTPNNLAALYSINAGSPPFKPVQFSDVTRKTDRQFDVFETLSYLPGPVIAPYVPIDFPTPIRAKDKAQDFFYQGTINLPVIPFAQRDWPLFHRARSLHQDFQWSGTTTIGLPAGVSLPFSLKDWPTPLPRKYTFHDIPPDVLFFGIKQTYPFQFSDWPTTARGKHVPGESYQSPQIILTTLYPKPFLQADWPTPPRKANFTRIDEQNMLIRLLPPTPVGPVMPNVVGVPFLEALEVLQAAGVYTPPQAFSLNTVSQITVLWTKSSMPGGWVTSQSINSGLAIIPGMALTLTIAEFPFSSVIDMPPDWWQRIPGGFKY